MATEQETLDRIDALKTFIDEKSTAEHTEVLTEFDTLNATIADLRTQLGTVSPAISAKLDELEAAAGKISEIFTPAPSGEPTTGEGTEG